MTEKINNTCECDCLNQQPKNPSRRDFIKKASTLTIIGSTAFILEACGGGGSPTSSGGDTDGGGDTGGGNATITYSYQTFNKFKVDASGTFLSATSPLQT